MHALSYLERVHHHRLEIGLNLWNDLDLEPIQRFRIYFCFVVYFWLDCQHYFSVKKHKKLPGCQNKRKKGEFL